MTAGWTGPARSSVGRKGRSAGRSTTTPRVTASLARSLAEQALAYASDPRQPLALIAVHRFLGQLDTEEQQFETAEEHLRESLKLADACQAPFERALTLLEIAKLRAGRSMADEARTLLAEVRAICEPLEAKPTLEKVVQLEIRLNGTV